MKKITLYLVLAAALLTSACSREGAKQQELVPVTIHIGDNVATKAADETSIKTVRIIMFGDGTKNSLVQNHYFASVTGNKVTFDTFEGTYDMYYIINEPAGLGATYEDILNKADIAKLKLNYSTPISSPFEPNSIPMFLHVSGQVVNTGATNNITATVVRQMAKIEVDLTVNRSHFPNGKHVEISDVTIKGLPTESYYVSKEYTNSAFVNSEKQIKAATTASGVDTYKYVFYVPEYIIPVGGTEATIEIKGKVASTDLECTWSEPVGDKAGGVHATNRIRRNVKYHFQGAVRSYGEHDMVVTTKVQDWTEVNIGEELN